MDVDAGGADEREEVGGIHARGSEKLLTQRVPELLDVPVQRPAGRRNDPADQGVAVGVQARGREREDDIAGLDALRAENTGVFDNPRRGARHVVFVGVQQPRVLGGLAAHESDASLLAGAGDAADDGRDPFGDDLAGGDVVSHEEGLGATDDDVIDDHADQVEADGVVPIEGLGDGDLGADPVGRRGEDRAGHPGEGAGVEEPSETAEAAEHLGSGGPADRLLH